MFSEPLDYTKDNMDKALRVLEKYDADMGGTELIEPLEFVFSSQ